MHIKKHWSLLLLSFLACLILPDFVRAADKQPQESWHKTCEQVKNVSFPAADRPSPKDLKTLDKCSPYELYYGFQETADPQKARLCAYAEMDHPWEDGPFDGKAILMTIYANGIGAKRNLDLALKLACTIDGAPVEVEGRVQRLAKMRAQNWRENNFSLCDDVSSGYLAGFCANHKEKYDYIARDEKLSGLQARWTKADKKEFAVLNKIAYQYFEVHADKEVDRSGTARAALYIEDKAFQEDFFIKTLEMLEKKSLPKYSDQQFKDADIELNNVYLQAQKRDDSDGGTVTRQDIKITQRIWIKYKDAFVKFCQKKYPGASDSIKTHLTLKRINELKEFIN
ncbi:MAG: lysozyme inhibitor LprI family protein [Smithella sp.]